MTPDQLFQLASPLAVSGWLALLASPLAPRTAQVISAAVIPLVLSLAYAGLVLAFWWGAPGGFGSLADVQALSPIRRSHWRAGCTIWPSTFSLVPGPSAPPGPRRSRTGW